MFNAMDRAGEPQRESLCRKHRGDQPLAAVEHGWTSCDDDNLQRQPAAAAACADHALRARLQYHAGHGILP